MTLSETPSETPPEDPRVRFAAERTLLAWVRTGIALMGFGFVVARFGLFLRELATVSHTEHQVHSTKFSMMFGVALTLAGVFATAFAAWEYRKVLRRIDGREPFQPPRVSLGLLMAGILSLLGVVLAIYLMTL
ncbi:MAG: DUF202 domain-containing protein [Gemmataceae bacterium]